MPKLSTLFLGKDAQENKAEEHSGQDLVATKYGILFVDDEENVLKAMRRLFRGENYSIFTASGGDEALEILKKESVQVVVSDYRMPGMTGVELLSQVKEFYPQTIRIMLTGYADVNAIMGAVNAGAVYKFITKPWNDDDLRLTVSLALEQYDLILENNELKKEKESQKKKISRLSKFVNIHRSQVGQLLLKNNLIKKEDLDKALVAQSETNKIIPVVFKEMGIVDEKTIMGVIQADLGINVVSPAEFQSPKVLTALIPRDICIKNLLVPLKRSDGKLIVAMGDPTDHVKVDDLKFIAGMPVVPVLATQSDISEKIIELYGHEENDNLLMSEFEISDPTESIEIIIDEDDQEIDLAELIAAKDKPPAIRIVNAIISDALQHGASDVHIEPKTKYLMVRFRIDGLLHDKIHIPISMHPSIISRIKVMAELDIAERRRPQDGRVTVKTSTKMVDMRLSTLPTINGEKIVLRILDRNASIKKMDELGFSDNDLLKILQLGSQPQGCILSTGPTGSGKTSTLYSLLQKNATMTKNFTTIEDPVEYYMGMAEQVMIKEKIGLSFHSVLRAILRQDPNVVMLGEIRDYDTAEIAFHAALTGHLVMSTLHTNGCVASITRLMDMGMKSYVLSDALIGIIAQRLVRRVCKACKTDDFPTEETYKALKIDPKNVGFTPSKGKGCDKCNNSGYDGRIGIFEVLQINSEIKQLIHKGANEAEITKAAKWAGMNTLFEDAIEKIKAGITTCNEVLRVLGPQNILEIECPHCENLLLERYNYCPYCAGIIVTKCVNCDCYLESEWKACPSCGTKIQFN